ncbi:hypothetical protein RJ640_016481 [Escallonia rubra]|uniref:TF-B3 domain-containing protein n=1 Tax=Escallonia rubra TaxID=112253 RepID=A0AA88QWN6_9ASTE|nr:hypothetical protein RJ640_016481 [Escallonia rubra]
MKRGFDHNAVMSRSSMHCQKERDSRGPISPACFYRIILPSVIDDHKLRIPKKFAETYWNELSDVAKLVVPNGCVWDVGLEKADKMLWLHDGWKQFMEHHSIGCGYFLLFKYKGNSTFNVVVFDLGACEIHYPTYALDKPGGPNYKQHPVPDKSGMSNDGYVENSPDIEQISEDDPVISAGKEEMDDDDSVEILGSSRSSSRSRQCLLRRSKRYNREDQRGSRKTDNSSIRNKPNKFQASDSHWSCLGKKIKKENQHWTKTAKELQATVPPILSGSKLKISTNKAGEEGHGVHWSSSNELKKFAHEDGKILLAKHEEEAEVVDSTYPTIFFSRISMTMQEKETVIYATTRFRPVNPAFIAVLRRYNVHKSFLVNVPRGFAVRYLHGAPEYVELEVSDLKKWHIDCIHKDGVAVALSRGWAKFVRDNSLAVGDVCTFELVRSKDVVLRVSIFRNTENAGPIARSEMNSQEKILVFFKFFLPEHSSQRMEIPLAFTLHMRGVLPDKAMLRDRYKNLWPVEVAKIGNNFFFQDGWRKFLEDNCVEEGDFLVFQYDGGCFFDFKLLGATACEKEGVEPFCFEVKDEKEEAHQKLEEDTQMHEEEDEEQEEEEVDEENDDNIDDEYDEEEDEEEWEEEEEEEEDDDEEYDEEEEISIQGLSLTKSAGKNAPALASRKGKTVVNVEGGSKGINVMENDDGDCDDIFKSGLVARPKNPYFVAKMRPTRKSELYIPTDVIKDFKIKLRDEMVICNQDGKTWTAKVSTWYDGRTYLTKQWRSFFYIPADSQNSHKKPSNTGEATMATATATLSPATFTAAAAVCSSQRRTKVNYISGLNSFGGLKAHNNVVSLGRPACTEQSFAKVVSSLKYPSKGNRSGGGALTSTCNAAGEIFRIAAIMNGLTLVGVAVGFVLLRIEAFVEESE